MASGVFDDALIKHLWSTDELRAIFNDRNRVQKWYEFEAALALEQGELGIIPREAAQEIARNAKVENVDIEAIAAEIRRIKHPLVPALKALQDRCKPELGEFIHFGPTTQDVLDTATVLQIKEAHAIYLRDMKAIGQALVALAEKHKATPMVGRSHGVQALPITFGHKAAIWLSEMGRHYERMRELEPRVFVGGMVGAVGTQASFGPKATELEQRVMKRLRLGVADINWQPARDRFAEVRESARADRRHAGQDRERNRDPRAHRSGRARGAFQRRQARLVDHAAQAQSFDVRSRGFDQPRAALQRRVHARVHGDRARARRLGVARRMEGTCPSRAS